MLSQILYSTASPQITGEVVYDIFEDKCVFSGITRSGSTINSAEEIVERICTLEKKNPDEIRFFDLQTQLGYNKDPSGEFEFDEVMVEDGREIWWAPTRCPQKIVDLFRHLIGVEPKQSCPRELTVVDF